MAINPELTYPGKINSGTPAYPYGQARNVVTSGDGTGTPWEQALVNDIFGFQQAILVRAGITPSNTADTALLSEYLRALETVALKRLGTTADILTTDLAEIPAVITDSYASVGDGGGAKWVATGAPDIPGNAGTSDFPNGLIYDSEGRQFKYSAEVVNVRAFGAVTGAAGDDTLALQAAADFVGSNGGGIMWFPAGTYNVSIITSAHPNACLLISSNTRVRGEGRYSVLITRPAAERGTDGVLIVNKNYDTAPDYGADGNLVFEEIGVSDGAATPNRALGDLIGFGNGDGLVVQNCFFGNHDQHAVDIAKSRNVIVRWNDSSCQVNQSGSAVYQIDAGLIWGIISGVEKDSVNVWVYGNTIKDTRAANAIHFHTGNFSKNCFIFDNTIDGSNLPDGGNAIGGDTDISYENVRIFRNTITLNNPLSRGINLPVLANVVTRVRDVFIQDNHISGVFRIGVFAGDDAPALLNYDGPLQSVYIERNALTVDLSTLPTLTSGRLIAASHFKSMWVRGNSVRITINGALSDVFVIEDNNNGSCHITENVITQTDDGATAPAQYYGVQTKMDFALTNGLAKHFDVARNDIDMPNVRYHISTAFPGTLSAYNLYTGAISQNYMRGTPAIANIFESVGLSDGTNNETWVDFTGFGATASDPYVRPVAAGQYIQNVPLPGTKTTGGASSRTGDTKLKVVYSPLSETGFHNDVEEVSTVYTSSVSCAGIITKDIDSVAGVFDIVTGVSGVSMVINDTTFQPAIRPSGWIKIRAGI